MFFETQGIRTVLLIHPKDMHEIQRRTNDLNNNEFLKKELFQKVEGIESQQFGHIIYITNIRGLADPIIDLDGFIKVEIQFDAITFKLEEGQTVDIVVQKINNNSIDGTIGPDERFCIPIDNLPDSWHSSIQDGKLDADGKNIIVGSKLRVKITAIHTHRIICSIPDDENYGYIE
ncbi:RNA polymerase n-terminal domain protein [Ichthyophthirius multifiliis]|uniref:RNA polymerase n-terminal domain protein n=1 Tax=Ichthyophthirius multifiliis TaxID=5932 RepID=G0QMU0_ICHMU|nr:RNA polymerase n-terminal domain protein [Ichthyophthirius multifiliis]EGR33493.1 RNA polymerase n-terminal domain protein [Ichthyophthirius multifiliis]|eukprot:XP_004037479.1 RNA polymerase n-terminal domain protein [Ichthyophthirius multifiliis]